MLVPSYGVDISQLICFVRIHNSVSDFIDSNIAISEKHYIPRIPLLSKTFTKFHYRYEAFVYQYNSTCIDLIINSTSYPYLYIVKI